MPTPLIGYPNRIDGATLSGGSWLAALPLDNMKTRELSDFARSSDDAEASTKFLATLAGNYPIRAMGLFGHNLSLAAQVRMRLYQPNTFARADTSTYVDEDGVVTAAASGELRQWHYLTTNDSVRRRVTLLERAYTNKITTALASWTEDNASITSTTEADPMGGNTAIEVTAAAGSAVHQIYVTPTTAIGKVGGEVWFQAGTYGYARISVSNGTDGSVNSKAVNLSTGAVVLNTGTTGHNVRVTARDDGWVRVQVFGSAQTVANSSVFVIICASDGSQTYNAAGTETIKVWRPTLFEAAVPPESVLAASEATTADSLTIPLKDATPQECNILYEGAVLDLPGTGTYKWPFNVGDANTGSAALGIFYDGPNARIYVAHENGTTSASGYWSVPSLALGDHITVRLYQAGTGAVTARLAINGGAEAAPTSAIGTIALAGAWANARVRLSARASGVSPCNTGTVRFVMQSGAEMTLTELQALTGGDIAYYHPYDSEWTAAYPDIYPAGATLWGEEKTGALSTEDWTDGRIKYGVVNVLPAIREAGYATFEVSDTANADGYVDIGRPGVWQAWDPGRHFAGGASIGARGMSQRFDMPYGGAHFRERQQARFIRGTFEGVLTDEAMVQGLEGLHLVVGTTRQVLYVHDTEDTYHMPRRSWVGTVTELSPIEMPYATAHDVPVEILEDIA